MRHKIIILPILTCEATGELVSRWGGISERLLLSSCKGMILYFRPGHETYPIYHDNNVRRVIANTVQWAKPTEKVIDLHVRRIVNSPPLEKI